MKQVLIALVIFFLAASGLVGYLYFQGRNTVVSEDTDMISRDEAEQMVADALAGMQTEEVEEPAEEPVEPAVPEEPVEPVEEPVVEPVKKKPTKTKKPAKTEKKHYYRFTVGTMRDNQNVRRSPNGEIITNVPKGTTGYIVERGDEWSLVAVNGQIAYMATRYLQIEEIKKSEFPASLKGITAADAGKRVA